MEQAASWLEATLGISRETENRIFYTLVVLLALWTIERIVLGLVWRRTHNARLRYRWQKATTYVITPVGILLIGKIWFPGGVRDLATYLGLVSAGIAIALKDIFLNLAGWIFIVWRRPFAVGDRIQIGEHAGDVIDVRAFHFTLNEIGNWVDADQSTGRIIHVPNGKVITDVIANYSEGFQYIWHEIPVLVTYESDWEKAKKLLLEIVTRDSADIVKAAEQSVRDSTRKFMILYTNLTPTVYTSVVGDGVLLTIRYLCEPRKRRVTEQVLWEDILREFAGHEDVDFAYHTVRGFQNRVEGKQATGGSRRRPSTTQPALE
jgi:small-conductance mechanosensitive channel